MTDIIAHVKNLTIAFNGHQVVRGIDLTLQAGECLALVGESGSGKSVTARALLGLHGAGATVQADTLDIAGHNGLRVTSRAWEHLRGSTVGLIAQDALVSLDSLRRVGDEVGESLIVHNRRTHDRMSRRAVRERVIAELERVAIPDPHVRARQYPHELSGGLRQRALVASATITRPPMLIADEPTTALDLTVQAEVLKLLLQLKQEGVALLLISHDLTLVSRIADRVAVMREGEIVEQGDTTNVLEAPAHDYTRMLLSSSPALHARKTRLTTLPPLSLKWMTSELPDATEQVVVEQNTPVLTATDITQDFAQPGGGVLRAVDHVSLRVFPGQTLGIVGESGSGKTTLGRVLMGFQRPDAGEVTLLGARWSGVREALRRPRRGLIQSVYQDPLSSFDPRRTIGTLIGEALTLTGIVPRDLEHQSVHLLESVGLTTDHLTRYPLALSGGQRQRVAIARALARNPRVVVCDEPVSALDVSIQAQVLDVFADVQEQLGLAMVFISHDLSVVHHISDEVMVMHEGRVVEHADAERLFSDPQHAYTRRLLSALPITPSRFN